MHFEQNIDVMHLLKMWKQKTSLLVVFWQVSGFARLSVSPAGRPDTRPPFTHEEITNRRARPPPTSTTGFRSSSLSDISLLSLFVLSVSLFSSGSLSSSHLVSRAAVTEVNRLVIDLFSTARHLDGPKSSALYLPYYPSDAAAPIVWPFEDVRLPHLCWR